MLQFVADIVVGLLFKLDSFVDSRRHATPPRDRR